MDNWLKIAESLKIGQSRKVVHECSPGGDPSLSITHEPECYRGFCHRCKEKLWHPKRLSLGELIQINQERRDADKLVARTELPEPRVYDMNEWPVEASLWLLKVGISSDDAREFGIYYHPPTMRVVVPYQGTHHWQARAVMEGHKPKYIGDRGTRQARVMGSGMASIVLTEDLLSAYKMVAAGRLAMPLMGTTLHDEHLATLLAWGNAVSVWLDGDKPGQDAAAKICKRLSVFGVEHRNVLTEEDPKTYSRDTIRSILERTWH